MTRLYALVVLALLVYGLVVGCQAYPHPMNLEPGAHRACFVQEREDVEDGSWIVEFICRCPTLVYAEIYRRGEIQGEISPADLALTDGGQMS